MSQQIIKLILKGRLVGTVETRNIFHYGCNCAAVQDNDIEACKTEIVSLLSIWQVYANAVWTAYGIEVEVWDGEEFQPRTQYTINMFGTEVVDLSSYQTAVLLTAKTALKGVLGRKFLPGLDELYSEIGQVASGILPNLLGMAAFYLEPALGPSGSWYPGTHGSASVFAPFISVTVGNILSTMRRRKPGYGS